MEQTPSRGVTAFDALYAALSFWFIAGIYTDGWAHNHLPSALETFFTPWHAALYSGFTVTALAVFFRALAGRSKGASWFSVASWREALPAGYFPSLVGAAIFALGGGFDFAWHSLFGIEKDIEALVSPAHLVLAVGGFLMFSGPLRAAWYRRAAPSTTGGWLVVALSIAATLSVITFMTMFAHPVRHFADGLRPGAANFADVLQGRATAGFLFQMSLLSGFTLLALRRWGRQLPPAFFGFIYGLNMLGMSMMVEGYEFRLIPAAIVAGLVADGLNRALRPDRGGTPLRIFAATVPALYATGIFVTLLLTADVWWSVHMWSGAIVLSGIAGLLMSLVASPPRMPAEQS